MKRVLVDTNIIIDFLRRKDKKNSIFYKVFYKEKNKPIISLTTITELWAGKSIEKKESLKFIEGLVKNCEIFLPSLKTAKLAGKILRQTNYQIPFQDAQIASLTLENNLPLLTLDKKDFKRIKGIKHFQPKTD